MKQQWPDDDVIVKLIDMFKKNPEAGFIQYLYHVEDGPQAPPEAIAKAVMELMELKVAMAVDVVNGVIFIVAAIFEYAINNNMEDMLRSMGFRALFDMLKSQGGIPVRVIEIRKNGSVKYLD